MRPFNINAINDNKGSRRYPKDVGRGPGSGKGYFLINIANFQQEE